MHRNGSSFAKPSSQPASAAFEYGRLAAELRRIRRPIGQNDMMIAAVALTLGNCTVVTMDGDFSAILGLVVENWPS